ncbi:TolA-binding protein [Bradyrhizobium sp. LM6.11]
MHHGKQVRLGPVVFWIVVGTVVLLGLWSAATATYFAFRDDVLSRLIARQAEMQYAYEDRITELRAKVDRTTSRQLLDQEQFDQKLDQIMKRQTALESRATALGAMPDVTGSIPRSTPQRGDASQATQGTPKPLADQRHRDFRGAAGSRSAARIARADPRGSAGQSIRQEPGVRQRRGSAHDLA